MVYYILFTFRLAPYCVLSILQLQITSTEYWKRLEPTDNHTMARGRTIRNKNTIFKMKIMIHIFYDLIFSPVVDFKNENKNQNTSRLKISDWTNHNTYIHITWHPLSKTKFMEWVLCEMSSVFHILSIYIYTVKLSGPKDDDVSNLKF